MSLPDTNLLYLPPVPFTRASEWAGQEPPPPIWTLEGWLPYGCVSLLYGDGGVGKSLLALSFAVRLVTGLPFMSIPVNPQRVLVLSCEDDSKELQRRVHSICKAYGIDQASLDDLLLYSGVGEDNTLFQVDGDKPPKLTELFYRINSLVREEKPNLVIIDTAADTFAGNEVSRKDVRAFMTQCLGKLTKEQDCSVLLLAHPSQAGIKQGFGYSGSTAWNNSARSRLYLDFCRDDNGNVTDKELRVLRLMKSNYAEVGAELRMRYQDGAFVSDIAAGKTSQQTPEDCFLNLMRQYLATGRNLSSSRNAANYAPKVFSKMPAGKGFKKYEFERVLEKLLGEGVVIVEFTGQAGRKSQRLVFAENRW